MAGNNSKYISAVFVEEFGNLHNAELCNLQPGLNVIYGKNEAGKTSFTEFIEASIAGFTPKKKDTNNYSQPNIKRSGFLEFCDAATGETFKFQRFDDVNQPVQCETDLDLPPNRDRFEIVNKITSDSLLMLDKDNRINQIAAAGASTIVSPDKAIENLSADIETFKSRKRDNDNSLPLLQDEIVELQTKIHNQEGELMLVKQTAGEGVDFEEDESRLNEQLASLNIEISQLQKCASTLDNPIEYRELENSLHTQQIELAKLTEQEKFAEQKVCETNNELQQFMQNSKNSTSDTNQKISTPGTLIGAVVASVVLVAAAIAMFICNIAIGGVACLAFAAIAVLIAILANKSNTKAKQANANKMSKSIQDISNELLDTLNQQRATKDEISKKIAELNSQIAASQAKIDQLTTQSKKANEEAVKLLQKWGLPKDASVREIMQKVDECVLEQQKITRQFTEFGQAKEASKYAWENLQTMEEHLNNLNSELDFLMQLKAQLSYKLATKLVARQIVTNANTRWQQEGGYDQNEAASNYLKIMTEGRWDTIEPKTYMVSNSQTSCELEPFKLSRATTQQTYLAVRMAVLQSPKCTYRDTPVLCDDILVDFDNDRTECALNAIAELAKHKQVIMFTAHKDFAELAKNKTDANIINL